MTQREPRYNARSERRVWTPEEQASINRTIRSLVAGLARITSADVQPPELAAEDGSEK